MIDTSARPTTDPQLKKDEIQVDMLVLLERLTGVQDDISEIKGSMNVMASAIQKMAIIEERQATATADINRLRAKVEALEAERSRTASAAKWVDRGIVGVVTAAAIFAAKKIGLM